MMVKDVPAAQLQAGTRVKGENYAGVISDVALGWGNRPAWVAITFDGLDYWLEERHDECTLEVVE